MPKHVFMSDYAIIPDGGRRRRWSAAEKLRIVEETLEDGASISVVARRNGVAAKLLYRWRRLMLAGGAVAVSGDDDVTSNRAVRQMEERLRELERQLGRETLEVEILKEAFKSRLKNRFGSRGRSRRAVPVEGRGRDAGRLPLEPECPAERVREAASALSQSARRGGAAADLSACGGATDLWLPAHHGAAEPAAQRRWCGAHQPQTDLSHHAGARPTAGSQIHRAAGADA